MYSEDMRREASMVSRSGPLMEVTVYGAMAVAWLLTGSVNAGCKGSGKGMEIGR